MEPKIFSIILAVIGGIIALTGLAIYIFSQAKDPEKPATRQFVILATAGVVFILIGGFITFGIGGYNG